MTINAQELRQILINKPKRPVYIWGDPGIGKSDVVKQAGEELGVEVVDVRLSLMDPADLRGVPMASNGEAVWLPPSFLPKEEGAILFFDEFNLAPPSIQGAAYQIILDGKIGEHVLPPNTMRIAASNPTNKAGMLGHDLALPTKNRFIHYDMVHDYNAWIEWAEGPGSIDPRVIGWIRSKPDALMDVPRTNDLKDVKGFPTPRSWHYVSDCIYGVSEITSSKNMHLSSNMITGCIGNRGAAEFIGFLQTVENFRTPEEVLADPSLITADLDKSLVWSVVGSVVEIMKPADVKQFGALLENRNVPREICQFAIKRAVGMKKHFICGHEIVADFLRDDAVAMKTRQGRKIKI